MGKPTIGAGISLDGESEFKKAISGINSDFKVLTSEVKKVTSEFIGNENSVEALTAKDEVLNKQLEKQKEKIEEVKKALDNAKSQYGETDERTKKWQTTLNNSETDLNKLNNTVKENKSALEKAQNPTEELAKDVKGFGDNAEVAGKKAFSMGDMIKANLISTAIISGVKALANAFLDVGKQALNSAKESAAYADEIMTLNAQTGVATDTLQELKYMEELTDVSLETVTKSMAKNIKSMKGVQDGTKLSVDAYKQLGVEVLNADGTMRDGQTVYWETIDALGKMKNETERDALAMTLLGKSAQDLNPIIEIGSGGMKKFSQEARDMGAVLSTDALESLGKYDDALQRLDQSTNILSRTFGGMFAPMLTEISTLATNYMAEFSKNVEAADGDAGKIGAIVGDTLSDIVNKIVESLPEIIKGAKEIVKSLAAGIKENMPTIIQTGLEIIVDLVKSLIESLPAIVQTGLDIIVQLALGIAEALPTLIPVVVETVMKIVDTLIDNIGMLVDASIAIIMGLTDGLITALPMLIDKLPLIIDKLVTAIVENMPKMLGAGIKLMLAVLGGLVQAIPQLLSKIPDIIKSIVGGFGDMIGIKGLGDVGHNLITGLWNGISDATKWLMDKIKGFASGVLNGIKSIFGIRSPSSLFRDEIGKNLALGIGEGFSGEMKNIAKTMNASIPMSFDLNAESGGGGYGYATSNLYMDSVLVASGTGKAQYRKSQSYGRALGVSMA